MPTPLGNTLLESASQPDPGSSRTPTADYRPVERTRTPQIYGPPAPRAAMSPTNLVTPVSPPVVQEQIGGPSSRPKSPGPMSWLKNRMKRSYSTPVQIEVEPPVSLKQDSKMNSPLTNFFSSLLRPHMHLPLIPSWTQSFSHQITLTGPSYSSKSLLLKRPTASHYSHRRLMLSQINQSQLSYQMTNYL